jgi:ATP-binding cassette subfamily F protein 3
VIRLDDLTVAPGGTVILNGADLQLNTGEHVGLVGRNGAGKTTVLRAIVGEILPDGGRVEIRPGVRVAWLPQQAVSGSTRSVWEEVKSGMARLLALQAELTAAEDAIAHDPSQTDRLTRASDAWRIAGGYAADERIGEVLDGLGFGPDTWHRSCATFSGGWQMRIALARLLLSDPDVALLDEPTNHLDLEARSWLAQHLARAPWSFVVVSHDRWLLDRCVTRIVEVRGGTLTSWPGNFTAWLAARDERKRHLEVARGRQQHEIARLERFVERFGAKATKAAQAKSKQKALDRIERVELDPGEAKAARIKLPAPPPGAYEAVTLTDATLGWSAASPVLSGVTFTLERGMRVALLGPNGSGKSTLLGAIAGTLPPLRGKRTVGDRVRIGVFAQDLAQALPGERTPLEHLAAELPAVPPQQVRTVLGALGLPGDRALVPIGVLSGGEKARVALAVLVLRPANVLLLDEPTNHLDAVTVDVLARAISAWEGALVLATHDRFLVESVATHVARVRDGTLDVHAGVRPEDFERDVVVAGPARVNEQAATHGERKKRLREAERARRRIDEIHDEITVADAEVARIVEELVAAHSDHVAVRRLDEEHRAALDRVEALYAEWEVLEDVT